MLLVYDDNNVLHITNERGLRWNYEKTQKPQFGFDYDNLFYNPFSEETNYTLSDEQHELSEENIQEIFEILQNHVEITSKEEGCEEFTFAVDINNPNIIRATEVWSNMQVLENHFKTENWYHFNSICTYWKRNWNISCITRSSFSYNYISI